MPETVRKLAAAAADPLDGEAGPGAAPVARLSAAAWRAIVVVAAAYFFELGDLNTFSYAATGLIAAWGVSVHTIAVITSATFVGMLIGALAAGSVAARIGRRPAFLLALIVFSGGSLLNALSWDVGSLAAFRFVSGAGLSALTIVANTYITEVVPGAIRGRTMAIVMTIGFIGVPVTAFVARFVVPLEPWGWRLVFVWGGLGFVLVPFVRRLPESPSWLQQDMRQDAAPSGGYRALFASGLRARTIMLVATWAFVSLGFYGFYAWVPALLVEHGFSVVKSLEVSSLMAICNPLGAALAIVFIERLERKYFFLACSIVVAVAVTLYGEASTAGVVVMLGSVCVLGMQAAIVGLYAYSPEIFPTAVRAQGMAAGFSGGRVTNIFGSFVVSGLYYAFGYYSVFLFVGACWIVGGLIVAVFGPLATGRLLQDV